MKRSGIKPPSTFSQIASPPRVLNEIYESSMNARTAMQLPTAAKHKPSGCKIPVATCSVPDRPLTTAVPEPAFKQRKTLAEQAGEPIVRKLPAPTTTRPAPSGVKSTIARGLAASTSRATTKSISRHPSAAALSGSVGAGPRAPTAYARPKSAYGQSSSHARSKSYHTGPRPATSMVKREEDDDSEEAERKGVQAFHISTNPTQSLRVPKWPAPVTKQRPNSLHVLSQRAPHVSATRTVSSPSNVGSTTPVMEEPAYIDCDDICGGIKALNLDASKADNDRNRVRRGTTSGKDENPFLKPKKPSSQLPQPTPTPIRQQQPIDYMPFWPPSTPRKQVPAPFLNRFTNDRCPDFYNERMEAMERDFRMFKEKMEGDVGQATGYKESIQQLQSRGTLSLCNLSAITAWP